MSLQKNQISPIQNNQDKFNSKIRDSYEQNNDYKTENKKAHKLVFSEEISDIKEEQLKKKKNTNSLYKDSNAINFNGTTQNQNQLDQIFKNIKASRSFITQNNSKINNNFPPISKIIVDNSEQHIVQQINDNKRNFILHDLFQNKKNSSNKKLKNSRVSQNTLFTSNQTNINILKSNETKESNQKFISQASDSNRINDKNIIFLAFPGKFNPIYNVMKNNCNNKNSQDQQYENKNDKDKQDSEIYKSDVYVVCTNDNQKFLNKYNDFMIYLPDQLEKNENLEHDENIGNKIHSLKNSPQGQIMQCFQVDEYKIGFVCNGLATKECHIFVYDIKEKIDEENIIIKIKNNFQFQITQEEDKSLLTKHHRNKKSKQLIQKFNKRLNNEDQLDPINALIKLYIQDTESENDKSQIDDIVKVLTKCRINPDQSTNVIQRKDLEFYLPQICTYLVFHLDHLQEFDKKLPNFLKRVSQIDFYFAHSLYFYLNSLKQTITKDTVETFPVVEELLHELCNYLTLEYGEKKLILSQFIEELNYSPKGQSSRVNIYKAPQDNDPQNVQNIKKIAIQTYGTMDYEGIQKDIKIKPSQVPLENYVSIFQAENQDSNNNKPNLKNKNKESINNLVSQQIRVDHNRNNGFQSTISFFEDLVKISNSLTYTDPKIVALITQLRKMNQNLPAAVYVPFTSNSVRNYAVLNIVVRESKVFSTKERTPFYICIEIFRPEEENEYELLKSQDLQKNLLKDPKYKWQYDKIVSNPRTCQSEENKIKSVIRQRKTSEGAIANQYLGILHSEDQTIQKNLLHNDNNGDSQQNANGVPQLLIQRRNTFSDGYSLNSFDQNQKEMKQYDVFKNYNSQEKVKSQSQDEIFQNNDENIESEQQESPNQTQQEIISNNKLNVVIKKNNKKSEKVGGVSRFYMDGAVEQLDDGQQSQISIHNKNGDLVIEKDNTSKQNDQNSIITECSDTSAKKIDFNKKTSLEILRENLDKKLFGEDEKLQAERIRKASPYKHFKSHKLVHLIIKTGDNLKQEQFAMQLLQQFDQIFTEEGLNLKIRTYDIMSIGPDAGLVEMVKNATTFDNLKKQLHENFSKQISNLYHFFKVFYGDKIKKAQELFCQSLAAYSLICYFMQIKDRHNGNILLHKDGYMVHIDFGFFLSNAPGKGLAFEKKVPFKLLSEYIEILGGIDSKFFEQFRILFYKGFMALRKHQDKILILVKMLYTGHGSTLPCFEYGEEAINELDKRFNPSGINSDGEYYIHTQNLINQSLDNWRARWYDKFQYFCQGIYY